MNSIFSYTDYRSFLKDYIAFKKSENKAFSLNILADRAGFRARDYILRVINNTRNVSQSGCFMLSKALRLSTKETDYFINLVGFNQARIPSEKEFFFKKMSDICKFGIHQQLRQDQFDYFSEWYYSALRSLLPIMDFKDDFAEIGKFLDPPLTPSQVKKAVDLLEKLGVVNRDKNGVYTVASAALTAGDEVQSVALSRFHKQSLDLAKRAIDCFPGPLRDISGVTMSLSQAGFKKIKTEIQLLRKKAMLIAEQDAQEDGLFQLNMQFFPLSKRRKK
ncbi:MAG TPA: TIGR02147 family protein [Chitinivibrionales bacterium]